MSRGNQSIKGRNLPGQTMNTCQEWSMKITAITLPNSLLWKLGPPHEMDVTCLSSLLISLSL